MTINERITQIINDLFEGNKRAFSIAVGVSPAVIENIVGKRKSAPSFEVTSKIVSSIDNINTEWLIAGKGNMLKSTETKTYENNTKSGNLSETLVAYASSHTSDVNQHLKELEKIKKEINKDTTLLRLLEDNSKLVDANVKLANANLLLAETNALLSQELINQKNTGKDTAHTADAV